MYLLKKPKYCMEDYFDEILIGRHNNGNNNFIKTRLLAIKTILLDEEKNYIELGKKSNLHEIQLMDTICIPSSIELDDSVPSAITAAEMEKVYGNYIVDKPESDKMGRKVYDSILSNTDFSLCPYCSHRHVTTVDHYLPKSKFSLYAITLINMVPCCSDCNKEKLDTYNLVKEKMLIHPYFEDVSTVNWLKCKVIENIWPISFSYYVSDNIDDTVLKERLKNQFELLGLGNLYADNASRAFRYRLDPIVKNYNSEPTEKALHFLNETYKSYNSVDNNSWETKMLEAIIKSNWFLEEALPELEHYYQEFIT